MIESLVPSLEQAMDKTKEQMSKWEDSIDDIPMPDIEQYKMTLEEAKSTFKDSFEEGISSLKLTAEEASVASSEVFNATQESINELTTKMGEKVPDFDYAAICKSAAISAVAGGVGGSLAGGIGTALGTIAGGVGGALGKVSYQVAKHNGASEATATTIQIGVEVVASAGVLAVGKGVMSKLAVSSADNVASLAKSSSTESISKTGNIIDNTKVFVGDKIKAVGFETKGLINDSKTHIATGADGKQFFAKTSELIDMDRTIKMPYLGSNIDKTNSAGYLRDSKKFAQDYLEQFPETMSKNNINRIQNGLSPITDKLYLKSNPNHKTFLGQTLEHHHINNTANAGYMPTGLHRLGSNKDMMHVDNMNFIPEVVSLIKEKIIRS